MTSYIAILETLHRRIKTGMLTRRKLLKLSHSETIVLQQRDRLYRQTVSKSSFDRPHFATHSIHGRGVGERIKWIKWNPVSRKRLMTCMRDGVRCCHLATCEWTTLRWWRHDDASLRFTRPSGSNTNSGFVIKITMLSSRSETRFDLHSFLCESQHVASCFRQIYSGWQSPIESPKGID